MPYKYCQHVKENGTFCNSAALRGRKYCFYHVRSRARKLVMARAAAQNKPAPVDLPPLEDLYAVQVAIQNVLEGLASGTIDRHAAGLMLYGLQQAAANLRDNTWLVGSRFALDEDKDGRCVSYPDLESEFGLPEDIDLDARPDEAFPREFPAPERIVLSWPDTKTWLDSMEGMHARTKQAEQRLIAGGVTSGDDTNNDANDASAATPLPCDPAKLPLPKLLDSEPTPVARNHKNRRKLPHAG